MGIRIFTALLTIVIACAARGSAQGRTGDTLGANRIVLIDPGLSLGRAVFLFPSSPGSELPFRLPFMMSPGGDSGPAGPFIGTVSEPRADLMSPLRLQMAHEKISPFQMALGAIQTGAVGYMAYRHIKKYGMFR